MQPKSGHGGQEQRTFIEEARRVQIVDSAIAVIAEHGYRQASMARIAAHAGISRGLISYHFANKAELIAQVITTVYVGGGEVMGPQIDAAPDVRAKLRTYVSSNLDYMRTHPHRMLALIEIFTQASRDELPSLGDDDTEQLLAPLEELLRAGQESGEFRDFDTRTMAHAIRNVIDGVPPRFKSPGFDIDRCIDEVTTLFDLATRAAAAPATPAPANTATTEEST